MPSFLFRFNQYLIFEENFLIRLVVLENLETSSCLRRGSRRLGVARGERICLCF